jgi:hypothetical protein
VPELALLQHEVTELRERAALLSEQMHTAVLSAPCSSRACINNSNNNSNNTSSNDNSSNNSSSNNRSNTNSGSGGNSRSASAATSSPVKALSGLCQQCEHLRSDMSRYKAKLDEVRS